MTQLLHLVFGGDLVSVSGPVEFRNLKEIHFVGAYPNYAEAFLAWKGASQQTVDNAHRRYFVLHAHKMLVPDDGEDWIEWNGGNQPVRDVQVEYLLRSGTKGIRWAHALQWEHEKNDSDIVAYRTLWKG